MSQAQEISRLADPGPFPRVVLLDTVAYCNLFCTMCGFRSMHRARGYMSCDLYTKLIDEIGVICPDTRVWAVFFGEPLIRADIGRLVGYAKMKGLKDVVLNSNGNLLTARARAELRTAGLDAIYIGIDAATPETYARVRRGGNFQRVVDNTLALLQDGGPRVFVQFVLMKENLQELEDFTSFWKQQGATVKVRPKVTWAGIVSPFGAVPMQGLKRFACHWQMQTMSVLWDGRVAHCAVDYDGQAIHGDVNQASIAEVWGQMYGLRAAHISQNWGHLPGFCQGCSDWYAARAEFF